MVVIRGSSLKLGLLFIAPQFLVAPIAWAAVLASAQPSFQSAPQSASQLSSQRISQTGAASDHNLVTDCIQNFDPTRDYFPDKSTTRYARQFTVTYHKSYKVLSVRTATPDRTTSRYVLLQCGAPMPTLPDRLTAAPVISIPVKGVFTSSTTQTALLGELGKLGKLAGVDRGANQTLPEVIEAVRRGEIATYAKRGIVNVEKVVLESPSLVFSNGLGGKGYAAIANAGVPVVGDTDWLESTALGRAEWIKCLATFFNAEQNANQWFSRIEGRYLSLKKRVAARVAVTGRPSVMTGHSRRGVFATSGARSYVASLIHDAGGHYVWAGTNTETGTVIVDLGAELKRAADADFWINGGTWVSQQAMLADDPRYTLFKPFRTDEVWVYTRSLTAEGANDYWGRAMARPDLLLADLVEIFHPDLVPKHHFQWYRRVPKHD